MGYDQEFVTKRWNNMSDFYTEQLEPMTLLLSNTVHHYLRLDQVDRVLEVSCGSGRSTVHAIGMVQDSCSYTATDVAPKMVAKAKQRLNALRASCQVHVEQADAQQLRYEDTSFQLYVANLSLHLVPDADKMLLEAHRVLEKGGRAVFTVWGRREKSPFFMLAEQALINCGLLDPVLNAETRSNFDLGQDTVALKKRVLEAGFSSCVIWPQMVIYELFDSQRMVDWATRNNDDMAKDDRKRVRAECERLVAELLESGHPFGFEGLIVLAEK